MREEELVRCGQDGDASALEALAQLHRPFMYSLSGRMVGSSALRDELVQAGYIGLFQAVHRFDSACGVRFLTYAVPWILGEMRRALRDQLNNTQMLSFEESVLPDGRTLEETISGSDDADFGYVDLRMALSKLSSEEQILICLRYYRDRSQAETALIMRKSQSQISKLERRALDRMRCMLS